MKLLRRVYVPVLWDNCTACISPQTANRSSAALCCQSSVEVSNWDLKGTSSQPQEPHQPQAEGEACWGWWSWGDLYQVRVSSCSLEHCSEPAVKSQPGKECHVLHYFRSSLWLGKKNWLVPAFCSEQLIPISSCGGPVYLSLHIVQFSFLVWESVYGVQPTNTEKRIANFNNRLSSCWRTCKAGSLCRHRKVIDKHPCYITKCELSPAHSEPREEDQNSNAVWYSS